MTVVEQLLDAAKLDTDLLIKNDEKGDVFGTPRVVDFLFICPTEEKAELVASFLDDVRYGVTSIAPTEGGFRVLLQIEMPITQNVLCAVSGAMVCVASIFSVEYDGWGSALQSTT